jgi:hypothetical protein
MDVARIQPNATNNSSIQIQQAEPKGVVPPSDHAFLWYSVFITSDLHSPATTTTSNNTFGVLSERFRCKDNPKDKLTAREKLQMCFEAVVVLVQYTMEMGKPLFDI